MKIVWKEISDLAAGKGHGIDFLADLDNTPDSVIAVLRGFEWLRGKPKTVEIMIRPPDDRFDEAFLAEAKRTIAESLSRPLLPTREWLSPTVYAWLNG